MASKLIAVVGATGTGKSELAIGLAEKIAALGLRAEIINADAMQLYRGMDIGTAKLPITERRGINHHLIDLLESLRSQPPRSIRSLPGQKFLSFSNHQ